MKDQADSLGKEKTALPSGRLLPAHLTPNPKDKIAPSTAKSETETPPEPYSKYAVLRQFSPGSSPLISTTSIATSPTTSLLQPATVQNPAQQSDKAVSPIKNSVATTDPDEFASVSENSFSAISHQPRNTQNSGKSSAQVGGYVLRERNTLRVTQPHRGQSPSEQQSNGKSTSERKTRTFRCSDDEWKVIEDKARSVGMSPAAYMREVGLNGYVPLQELTAFQTLVEALRIELVRIGTNLNQATHRLNANGELQPYLSAFQAISRPLLDILGKVDAALSGGPR